MDTFDSFSTFTTTPSETYATLHNHDFDATTAPPAAPLPAPTLGAWHEWF